MERYESWLERAKSSYELSKAIVIKSVYYEDRCYQLQQAVEKAFKGLLIYFGIEPEFTHNIGTLLSEIEKILPINNEIKKAINLTNYAVQTRYPGMYSEVTKKEYKDALKITKNCLDWVIKIIEEKENNKSKNVT